MPNLKPVPDAAVKELHALYHEGAEAEPGPLLDRRILDAARTELRSKRTLRRPMPWWYGWLPATSAIAVVVLGVSITLRVMDEQEQHLREEMRSVQREGAAMPRNVEAKPALNKPPAAQQSARVDSMPVQNAPAAVGEQAAKAEQQALQLPQMKTKNEATSSIAQSRLAADESARMAAPVVAPAVMQPMQAVEKKSLRAESAAGAAASPPAKLADDAATPEVWLKHIRELRAAGRSAEAAQSLGRFRARYPDVALPDDLINK